MHFSTLPDARAEHAPDAPAIRDEAVALTNAELRARVQQVAGALADRGMGRGDVIAVFLSNRVELILILLAAWRIGAVVTPINPVLGPAEAAYQVEDASAKVIVAEDERHDLGVPTLTLDEISSSASREVAIEEGLADSDLALLIYTSGTTGNPKGVMLTHANLDAMTSSFIEWFEMDDRDHGLLILPLFHANGIVLGTLSPLRAGGR